jgi:hypothetical protein
MVRQKKKKDSDSKENRDIVTETITQLYPEDTFPKKIFPDLRLILYDFFIKTVHSKEDLRESAIRILSFRNLLNEHPQTIVLLYRRCIEKFIYYKHGKVDEREDILQEVITRLMEDKIYKIRARYDFNLKKLSTFTSYLMVTIRNIYIDIIRERNIRPLTAGELQPVDKLFNGDDSERMMNKLLIEEELLKLHTIMKLYYRSRPKLELCLKLKFRIPLGKEDTDRCFPKCSAVEAETLTQDFKLVKDKTMFEKIIGIFNTHEDKQSKSDTVRKWIFLKIDEIISHLNRTHGAGVYNRKNVGELVFLYYQYKGEMDTFPVSNSIFSFRG